MKNLTLSLFSLFALILSCPPEAAAAYGSQIMLEDLAGRVEVWSPATNAWAQAKIGQPLEEGNAIRTQDASRAMLRFPDGSVIQLDNKTTFEVSSIGSQKTELNLLKGRLKAFVRGLFTSRMQVRTPTAVAAIRGTELSISADENHSEMSVQEGRMEVQDNSGKELVIGSEERVEIGKEGHGEPQLASLNDPEVKPAFNPYTLQRELVRDQVVEGLQGEFARELKKSEYQLGKSLTDVYGRRVRLESYITRTAPNEIKFVFLNFRQNRFDHGFMRQKFNSALPERLGNIGGVFRQAFGVPGAKPFNWLTEMELFASNTVDNYQRLANFGEPIQITFPSYQACTESGCTSTLVEQKVFIPQTFAYQLRIFGPGYDVIKERFQFDMGGTPTDPSTWGFQMYFNGATGNQVGLFLPAGFDVADYASLKSPDFGNAITPFVQSASLEETPKFISFEQPSGFDAMHMRFTRMYPDGRKMTDEFALIDNAGNPFRFGQFAHMADREGHQQAGEGQRERKEFNWEFRIQADEFKGRDIDLVVDPRIFHALDNGDDNPRRQAGGCGAAAGC